MSSKILLGNGAGAFGKLSSTLALVMFTSACNVVSSAGPSRGMVARTGSPSNISGIRVIQVTDLIARQVQAAETKKLFSETLGDVRATGTIVGVGDVIQVNLWEAPPATLFGDSSAAARMGLSNATSQTTTFPEQRVGEDGQINIPFAGAVSVVGRTTDEIETDIIRRLQGKAHEPQAIVRIVQNQTATATIVGDVRASQRMPLTARGERLLDALAAAGGVAQPINKITIQITRGSEVEAMSLDRIIADPRQNIMLQTGDVITALFQPYSFTALGATGRNEEMPFEASGITLAQALGRLGGLQDQRADPKGVFIFRFEDPAALGVVDLTGIPTTPEGKIPVIYSVDMKDPASYFTAQNFPMRNKDMVYSSNAPLADIQKFVTIISSVVFPIVSVQTAIQR